MAVLADPEGRTTAVAAVAKTSRARAATRVVTRGTVAPAVLSSNAHATAGADLLVRGQRLTDSRSLTPTTR